jgi:3-hydroxypropanoate dehydrogenase
MITTISRPALALDQHAQELLFTEAHTANTFLEEPVSNEQLAAIYELVKWAPTAANTQPLRTLFVRSPEAKARLLPHLAEGNKAKSLKAPVNAILAADTEYHEYIPRLAPFMAAMKDRLAANPDLRQQQARFNAALQAGYFILGVRAAGLAAGPMGGFDAAGIDQEFFPDGRWRSIMVVNIGKPADDAFRPRQSRLEFAEVARIL